MVKKKKAKSNHEYPSGRVVSFRLPGDVWDSLGAIAVSAGYKNRSQYVGALLESAVQNHKRRRKNVLSNKTS